MPYMIPNNRHLLVKVVDTKEDESVVAIPDGWKPVKQHEVVKILEIASDCQTFNKNDKDCHIIIPGNMLISFTYQNVEHYLVQENYVLAKIVI